MVSVTKGVQVFPSLRKISVPKNHPVGWKKLHISTDHQPLVTTLCKPSVADVPKQEAGQNQGEDNVREVFDDLQPWQATECIRCRGADMLYVTVDQKSVADSYEELREFLELYLVDVHVPINLVNSTRRST
jgi:hypothetical protein